MSGPPPTSLFDLYPADVRPASPVAPRGNAGGFSGARLFRFRSGRGELVARRWPADGRSVEALEAIHGQLKRAEGLGFVPAPLPTLDGRTAVDVGGWTWEIAPWMPGTADLARPPSPAHLRLAFGGLAAFHSRLDDERLVGPSPGLARRSADLERLRRGHFGSIRGRIEASPADPASPLARRWLDRASALGASVFESTRAAAARPLPLQLCLKDARPHHFLFEGDRLSGLVDFGSMAVDSVAGDLARLLGEGVGPDREARGEALAAYEAIRPLSGDETRAIGAFERANALLAPSVWIHWHYFAGRVFEGPDAVVDGLGRCLDRLDEVLWPIKGAGRRSSGDGSLPD